MGVYGSTGGIRTHTEPLLRRVSLPVGLLCRKFVTPVGLEPTKNQGLSLSAVPILHNSRGHVKIGKS